ncbi:MAG: YidB family protein [Sideroxydans sp.]|nr:YidB family protein [Sideroxydans sp.]
MGLFDSIVGAIQSQANGATGGQGDLLNTVMGLVNAEGGLSGLVQKISASGLGEQVSSWVSTGANLPVSAEQIQAALGSSAVQDIASKLGIDTNAAAASLANFLPQVIDKLTPDGQVAEGGVDLSQALSSLSGLFGNKSA